MTSLSGANTPRTGRASRWTARVALTILSVGVFHYATAGETAASANRVLKIEKASPSIEPSILTLGNDCSSCHVFPTGFSHPVNFRPSTPFPDGFPLEGGLMTCNTCHAVETSHGAAGGRATTRGQYTGAALCAQCHQPSMGEASRTPHGLAVKQAHLPLSRDRRHAELIGHGLDAESRSCMECHDGSAGPDAGSHPLAFGAGMSETSSEHPIGVFLRETERTRGGDFRIATNPDERIRLFGGKVGCGSCHSVYSPEPADLVMSNRGSRLCLSCHTQ